MKTALFSLMLLALVAADAPTAHKVAKPATVTREEWGSQPQPIGDEHKHTPKYVTIHHAGVDWKPGRDAAAFVRSVQAWGQKRHEEDPKKENWPDLPYHFMIAPDGRIFEARPLEYEPQSNTNYPLQGHVGVELMGNFETQRPSDAQLKSCVAISAWLCQEYNIDVSQIAGHKDRAEKQTTCPGKDFYRYLEDGQFKKWVKATLEGKQPGVKMAPPLEGGPTVVIDTPPPATEPQAR
jgi:hypothetical protein